MTDEKVVQLAEKYTPQEPSILLHGCCSYEDVWKPGIKEWGATDKQSRDSGEVSILDYDKLKENMVAAISEAYDVGRRDGLEEAWDCVYTRAAWFAADDRCRFEIFQIAKAIRKLLEPSISSSANSVEGKKE